jgi:flavin-dependent dehydrogenase/2-polyprenyl-3-methyl-5-hydroxy-6-metoxy-1,4-benzoquinol methylase
VILRLRERRPQPELLDADNLPLDEIEKSLGDIRRVNRFWGGRRAAHASLLRAIVSAGVAQSVLDFGSGSGDLPAHLRRHAARSGIPLTVISLDRQIAHLATARRLFGVDRLLAADALRAPLADASVDWVFSAQFFHHFSPEENARVLREMARIARRGIFVLDLRRNAVARALVVLFGPFIFRSHLSVTDGRISIEQAYTAKEAAAIARRAGLRGVEARPTRPFRFVLAARGGIPPALAAARPRERFDVAVVGGGPAGACSAIALRRLGFSVVVLERDRFPRHKVCGEFLSPEAIDDLEALGAGSVLRAAGGESIGRGALYLGGRRPVEFPLPRPAVGLSRFLLDAMLAGVASDAGAEVRFGRRVEGIAGDLRHEFSLAVEGEDQPIAARAVLAAWGRWSPLDLDLGRPFAARRRGRFFGWSRHDRGDSSHLAGRVHLYFFRGGYCGLSRVEEGIVNFAGVVTEDELRRRGAGWEKFLVALVREQEALRADLAPLSPARAVLGTPAVFFERHAPAFDDLLAVGDAAGVRDPFTGDGQATAIRSGVLAAGVLAPFLRGETDAAGLEESWRLAYAGAFRARFTWDALIRKALFSDAIRRALLPVALPLIRLGIDRTRLGAAKLTPLSESASSSER